VVPWGICWVSSKVIARIISLEYSLLWDPISAQSGPRGTPQNSGGIGVGCCFLKNLQYLWNGVRSDQGYYWWPIGSRIRAFDWCQTRPWMTLNVVMHYVSKHMRLSELITKIWMKIDPYCQQQRCSAIWLVSGNITFMRIFAEVPWRRGAMQQWGNRKHWFQGFWTLRLRQLRKWDQHYYIGPSSLSFSPVSPFHWSRNMTLNDLSGLNGHFTLNSHYYDLTLRVVICLFTVVCLHTWPAEMCGSGV